MALETIADVEASGLWPGKVVTEVAPAGAFWEAEPEHQDYLEHYPNGYTCHFVRPSLEAPAPCQHCGSVKPSEGARLSGRPAGQALSFIPAALGPTPI